LFPRIHGRPYPFFLKEEKTVSFLRERAKLEERGDNVAESPPARKKEESKVYSGKARQADRRRGKRRMCYFPRTRGRGPA